MTSPVRMVTLEEIRQAADFLKGLVHRTPMMGSAYLSNRIGARIALKLELFQKTGSFKVRGVLNKLNALTDEEKASGVVSLSAGNHAASLAYGATQQGIASTIVMPAGASRTKSRPRKVTAAGCISPMETWPRRRTPSNENTV